MKLHLGRLAPLFALVLVLSACEGVGLPHTSGAHSPSASSPATDDPQRCVRLAKRGFTPCPPPPAKLALPPTTIRNATGGAVSDATAQQWGRAFQLTEAYYRWAMQVNSRDALTAGAMSDKTPEAVGNLFGGDLQGLDDAKAANGTLVVQHLSMTEARLVSVPPDLQDAMRRQGLSSASYAFAVRFAGPSRRAIRLADGSERNIVSRDATFSASLLIWGEQKTDPDLGTIWYEHGNYSCDGSVRNACQS